MGLRLFEILVVLALTGGGASVAWGSIRGLDLRGRRKAARRAQMQDDLRSALQSADYRKLDDFMLVWADDVSEGHMKLIQSRRDALYVDANS